MSYHLIVNQPLQRPGNVLAASIRFIYVLDPTLHELEEKWRLTYRGIAIFDSFNHNKIDIGIPIDKGEEIIDFYHFYAYDEWFKPDPNISLNDLHGIIEVFNDIYGDRLMIVRSAIGYAFYFAD